MLGRSAPAALAALLLLMVPATASAACGPRDIIGFWRVFVGRDSCDIRIPPSGLFAPSPCFNAAGRRIGTLTGRLHVDRACRVSGSAILKVGRQAGRLIVSGTMNASHDVVSGGVHRGGARLAFTAYAR